ncbi:hypothetical protein FDA94_26225 [Herbidospora galbida]|uniref:Uncharacterized protein n=1 Tax=Herbidospora galbida TaxID=2575442 RepID=A0A4U3M857_9ACTN|nr:hypothetical protein [Herbidospora galbida]TKK85178.1 hypothetical protein FDA94_26225 [Herbidospora galbida]
MTSSDGNRRSPRTTAGVAPNAADVTARARAYFARSVGLEAELPATWRSWASTNTPQSRSTSATAGSRWPAAAP